MPWPLPSAKNYGHDATMHGFRTERRASTIARLAKVIRERHVSPGLRRTLLTQARRLELLARSRFDEADSSSPARRKRRGK